MYIRTKINIYDGSIEWQLKDLDSTNGCKVNGKRVPAHLYFPLKNSDVIKLGATVFRFLTPEYDYGLAHNFAGIKHGEINDNGSFNNNNNYNHINESIGSSSTQLRRMVAPPMTVRNKPMLGSPSLNINNMLGNSARRRYSNGGNRRLTLARRVSMTPGSIGFRYQNHGGSNGDENANSNDNEEFNGGRLDFDDEYFMLNNMSNIEEEDVQMDHSIDCNPENVFTSNNKINEEERNEIDVHNNKVASDNVDNDDVKTIRLETQENDENCNESVMSLNISAILSPLHDHTNTSNSNSSGRRRRKRASSRNKRSAKKREQQQQAVSQIEQAMPSAYNTEMVENIIINDIQCQVDLNGSDVFYDDTSTEVPSPCNDFQHMLRNFQNAYLNNVHPYIKNIVMPHLKDGLTNLQETCIDIGKDTYYGINIQLNEISNGCLEVIDLLSRHNMSIETVYIILYAIFICMFCAISYGCVAFCGMRTLDINDNNMDNMCKSTHNMFVETIHPKVNFDSLPCLAPKLPAHLRAANDHFNLYTYLSNTAEEYFQYDTQELFKQN